METSIKVNIDDLLEKLDLIKEDEYNTIELIIQDDNFEDESVLSVKAVDAVENSTVDYGDIPFDSGEMQ